MSKAITGAALATALGACLAAGPWAAAVAGVVTFTGAYMNINPPATPGGRCDPGERLASGGPGGASGTSNLGSFDPTISHCITPPLPTTYDDGIFSFQFSPGNTLTGTYDGVLTLSGVAGTFNNVQNYTVTGGTGEFAGASGTFTGSGTLMFLPGSPPLAQSSQTFEGRLDLPGVPEPSTWMMLILGVAGLGATLRRDRRREASV